MTPPVCVECGHPGDSPLAVHRPPPGDPLCAVCFVRYLALVDRVFGPDGTA